MILDMRDLPIGYSQLKAHMKVPGQRRTLVLALFPTVLPSFVKPTTEGIVRSPSLLFITTVWPSSLTYATQLRDG